MTLPRQQRNDLEAISRPQPPPCRPGLPTRRSRAHLQLLATRIHRQKIFKNFERGRGELKMINFVRTVPLHLELPADEVESLRAFAIAHRLTMAELVSRWAQSLQAANPRGLSAIHPGVIAITGLVPREWTEVETEHQHHLLTKHS